MTNVPQAKMKRTTRITMNPMVRGFAPLNSKDSNVLSGMVFLQNLNFGFQNAEFRILKLSA
jgi:hypothetical protein